MAGGEGGVIAGHWGLLSLAGVSGAGGFLKARALPAWFLSRLRAYALRLGLAWGEVGCQIVDPCGEEGVEAGGGLVGGEGGVVAGHWGLLSLAGECGRFGGGRFSEGAGLARMVFVSPARICASARVSLGRGGFPDRRSMW